MSISITAAVTAVAKVSKDKKLRLSQYEQARASVVLQKRAKADWSSVEWDAAVVSLVDSWRSDPMQKETSQKSLAANEVCQICQRPAEPITLIRGRKAFFCKAHNVVTPAIVL